MRNELRDLDNRYLAKDALTTLQRDIDNKVTRQTQRQFELAEDNLSKRDVNKIEMAHLLEKT